jgi:dephospho-CoA kinase
MERRPYRLGLTGSIGMGKSTTAQMFADEGVPIWDADASVRRLYDVGGSGVAAIARLVPSAVFEGRVERETLRQAIGADPGLLTRIESAIHPLVAADRGEFEARNAANPVLLFDIPLLFETGAEALLDGVVVATASEAVQRARVLERPGMTEAHLERILSRQLPDREKRARGDYLVRTDRGLQPARAEVRAILQAIAQSRREASNA